VDDLRSMLLAFLDFMVEKGYASQAAHRAVEVSG
jgi:hypothetical protein